MKLDYNGLIERQDGSLWMESGLDALHGWLWMHREKVLFSKKKKKWEKRFYNKKYKVLEWNIANWIQKTVFWGPQKPSYIQKFILSPKVRPNIRSKFDFSIGNLIQTRKLIFPSNFKKSAFQWKIKISIKKPKENWCVTQTSFQPKKVGFLSDACLIFNLNFRYKTHQFSYSSKPQKKRSSPYNKIKLINHK